MPRPTSRGSAPSGMRCWRRPRAPLPGTAHASPAPGGAATNPRKQPEAPLHVSPRLLDTPFWRIELDDRGRIARLLDKARDRELLPAGELANRLVIFEDKPLDFDAWDIDPFHAAKARDVDQLEAA